MSGELILVVEDESHIADVVEYVLREHGYGTVTAADGTAGLEAFRHRRPDLVILDLNLPGIPGLDLFDRFRAERPAVPVIMLTSRTEEVDRVSGLEMGADDYVTKPFSPRELAARVRTVLRRAGRPETDEGGAVSAGPIRVDPEQLRVTCNGEVLRLSCQELKLLECLVRHPARIFPREILIERIYDGETYVSDRTIDTQVKRIRRRVGEVAPGLDPIRTVYGMGYKLNDRLAGEDA